MEIQPETTPFSDIMEPSYFEPFYAVDEYQKQLMDLDEATFTQPNSAYEHLPYDALDCMSPKTKVLDASRPATSSPSILSPTTLSSTGISSSNLSASDLSLSNPSSSNPSSSDLPSSNNSTPFVFVAPNGVSADRKQRRKSQNRAAQERYREKQQRTLSECLKRTTILEAELKLATTQKEHFRLMYEGLEYQMTHLRNQGS